MRTRQRRLFAWLVVVMLIAAWGIACETGPTPAEWVEEAARAHEAADRALEQGEPEAARQELAEFLELPPADDVADEDRRAVLQDVYFRLAEIELVEGRPADALVWSDRGLSAGRADDLFTANLLVTRGRALELLGREAEAATDYYEALRINERLLRQSLGDDEGEEER